MFEREVALYRRLAKRGLGISFLTWGGPEEFDFAPHLQGISILCNRFRLPIKHYERLAFLLHAPALLRTDVIKTNQTSAEIIAGPAALFWKKPLIARLGFLASDFTARECGADSLDFRREMEQEARLFRQAAVISVTTAAMAGQIQARLPEVARRMVVSPNYVDTDLFSPREGINKVYDVLFVGRLSEQKNIVALLDALSKTSRTACIIGDGSLAPLVRSHVESLGGRLTWLPQIENRQLPELMAQARLFVLPSLWEGHPKVLLEAMSAAMPVIGAASPGIRETIADGKTGILCNPSGEGLAAAISSLLADQQRRGEIGRAARSFIMETCSLERAVEKEEALIGQALGRRA